MEVMQVQQQSIIQYFELYISECEYSKKLRPRTIKGYREVFQLFLNQMPELKKLEDLRPYVLSEFFKRLSQQDKYNKVPIKPSTIRTYYNKLIIFFRWLEAQAYIPAGSMSKKVSKPPRPIYEDEKALCENDISKIITGITLNGLGNSFIYQRDMSIVLILMYTGIRKGELLGLRVQDIDFNNHTIFINGKTSKSKKSRYIPLHYSLATQLKTYLCLRKKLGYHTESLIVSSQSDKGLTEHGLKHWVKKYKKLSGVNFHIHRFRHTFACELAKKNADLICIMKALGHSSVRMTERYLRSINTESSREYINKLSY